MLELPDRNFKISTINMLKALMEKVTNTQNGMIISVEKLKTVRENQMKMLEMKNRERERLFNGLFSRLHTTEKMTTDLEDRSVKIMKTETLGDKKEEKETE